MVEQQPDPADVVAVMEAHLQAIALPAWPLYGLDSPVTPGFLGGIGQGPDGVTSIRLDYRPPGQTERLVVQTTRGEFVDLHAALSLLGGDEGQPLPLGDRTDGSSDEATEVIIDGVAVHAHMRRANGATAWAVLRDHRVVVVVATNTTLADVRLRRITDLQQLKQARTQIVAAALDTQREQ